MPKPAAQRSRARPLARPLSAALRHPVRALTLALVTCAAVFASPDVAIADSPAPNGPPGAARELVSRALGLLGVPYKWGGNNPESGLDCSGLVRHVFADAAGLVLPRRSIEMSRAGAPIGQAELQPGDLVFFNTLRRTFSHVGIYIGEGRFVHAPSSGGKVRVERISGSYWASRFNGGRRLIDPSEDDSGPSVMAAGLSVESGIGQATDAAIRAARRLSSVPDSTPITGTIPAAQVRAAWSFPPGY